MCRIYFYSRPCGRGDGQQILKVYEAKDISTHAPAGGATHRKLLPVRPYYISTHAPAGGATGRVYPAEKYKYAFLLTPLREGRRREHADGCQNISISTHAPAGGATWRPPP